MTPPLCIGQVRIPSPWESEDDLRRLDGWDLAGMSAAQLERERRRLVVALGLATDDELASRILGRIGAPSLTVEAWLVGRLERVDFGLNIQNGLR